MDSNPPTPGVITTRQQLNAVTTLPTKGDGPPPISDGMTLPEAARIIASNTNFAVADVLAALRAVGYVDKVHALKEVIELLSRNRDRLRSLEQLIPNLTELFGGFALVASLDSSWINPTTYESKKIGGRHWIANRTAEGNFLQWLFYHYAPQHFSENLGDKHPLELDVIVPWWLYGSAVRLYGDQIPVWRRKEEYSSTPTRDIQAIEAFRLRVGQMATIESGAAVVGYEEWLSALDADPGHRCELKLALAVKGLQAVQEHDSGHLAEAAVRPPPSPPPRMEEMELVLNHVNHPRPSELEKIQIFLSQGEDPSSPNYHEANLIALSIMSCRAVENNLHWQIHQPQDEEVSEDRIEWKLTWHERARYQHLAPVWCKAEHGVAGAQAVIFLPFSMQKWLASLDVGFGKPRLVDLLPTSQQDWAERAYRAVAQALDCSLKRAQLITRDVVSRLVYQETANSAVVHFFRSTANQRPTRLERIALGHYVSIGGGRSVQAHMKACKKVFGAKFWVANPNLNTPLGKREFWTSETTEITKELLKRYEAASGMVERHNRLAFFMLFACIAGTGHRRSTTPFPFPWDFHISEGVVFIADKLVTGSECRLVPLAPSIRLLLEFYVTHLDDLSRSNEVIPSVRDYAMLIADYLRTSIARPTSVKADSRTPPSGVFFELTVRSRDLVHTPISTGKLDAKIAELTKHTHTVRRLRATAASYLWESGLSGRSVQSFLGHQPEMHSFGAGSSWAPITWAEDVCPHIETYLVERGIGLRGATHPLKPCYPSTFIPSLRVVDIGYEGRLRDKKSAQLAARTFILQELNEYMLGDEEAVVTQEVFEKIRSNVQQALQNDPAARDKVESELRNQLQKLRQGSAVNVTANSAFLGKTAAGPMGIDFSRSYRCAAVFRDVWEANVGTSIGANTFDSIERLAHLAISLVVFDAVAMPFHLEALIQSLDGEIEITERAVTLRCQVVSATHDYYTAANLGDISSALVLGTLQFPPQQTGPALLKSVQDRLEVILRKLLGTKLHARWNVQKFCLMFQPYWQSRLPGAMYSIAIGTHRGPAPDARSYSQLHGLPFKPTTSKLPSALRRSIPNPPKHQAFTDLKKLFSESRGVLEKGEQTKKQQRKALSDALTFDTALGLSRWRSETQIVDILFSFISYLLVHGGRRVKTLAFGSLERYFSLIAKAMIALAWDTEFETISSETLSDLLDETERRVNDRAATVVIKYFNTHLRDEVQAPLCKGKWSNSSQPIRIRSSLVFPRQVSKAISLLEDEGDATAQRASVFIAEINGYGLRPKECLNTRAARFDDAQPDALYVQLGRIADLKTNNGRRFHSTSLNSEVVQQVIRSAVARAHTSPHTMQFLFEDSTGESLIARTRDYTASATVALRLVTGDPAVVPYHLRHSFATGLVLGLFALQKEELHDVALRMLGSGYEQRIKALLNCPKHWPFALELAAAIMGHADVNTLLNTYFHGSSFVIETFCARWQPTAPVPDGRLGAMLGWERSRLAKLRLKLPEVDSQCAGWKDVVRHFVRKAYRLSHDKLSPNPEHVEATSFSLWKVEWTAVSRVLTDRFESDSSLEEASEFAVNKVRLPPEAASSLIAAYKELVACTELDDFEPESSVFLKPLASHSKGTFRGRLERDRLVAKAQAWADSRTSNRAMLERFLERWKARVDAIHPRIVCVNQLEFDEAMAVLNGLGLEEMQPLIEVHGDSMDAWLNDVLKRWPAASSSETRASRGSKRVSVREVSIGIAQSSQGGLPDGRDLHRGLIAIAVACAAFPSNAKELPKDDADSGCANNS